MGLIPGSGRSCGEGNGNPLQYSCLENPMDGGTWSAIVHELLYLIYYMGGKHSPVLSAQQACSPSGNNTNSSPLQQP